MQQAFFSIGPLSFHFYGFFIALGVIFVYFWSIKYSKIFKIEKEKIDSFFIYGTISALVGARLFHVLTNLSYYLSNLKEIFMIWNGGLGILGAIIGLAVSTVLFCHLKKIKTLSFLNLIFPPFLVAQAIGRIGNFVNKEAFGPPTNLPWKIYIPIQNRPTSYVNYDFFHPTFFYESILCLTAFIIFLFLFRRKKQTKNMGFSYYLISYGIIRFFIEFFRIDTPQVLIQPLCLLMIIVGVAIIKIFRKE